MVKRAGLPLLLTVLLLSGADAQTASTPPVRKPQELSISAGYLMNASRDVFHRFWRPGPALAAEWSMGVQRSIYIGLELGGALFPFSNTGFQRTYPDIPVQSRTVAMWSVLVQWRFRPALTGNVAPFVSLGTGVARITPASYKVVINGIRVTYYELPGRTRLALGLTAGCDFPLAARMHFRIEGGALYVHHDPDAGALLLFRAGLRFRVI